MTAVWFGHEGNRSTLMVLSNEAEAERVLAAVRPRDCDFVCYEMADSAVVLPLLPADVRLLVGGVAGPVLRSALEESWRDEPGAAAMADYLAGFFPPALPVPVLDPRWVEPFRRIALGEPGQKVAHGLFPSTATKLARLALARTGLYPADLVWKAAENAYAGRPYSAHDAFACAIAHPEVDAGPLIERYGRLTSRVYGHRVRRKIHGLIRWAAVTHPQSRPPAP